MLLDRDDEYGQTQFYCRYAPVTEDDLTSSAQASEATVSLNRVFKLPVTLLVPNPLAHKEALCVSFRKIVQLILQLAGHHPRYSAPTPNAPEK